jgi:hypothetical protein
MGNGSSNMKFNEDSLLGQLYGKPMQPSMIGEYRKEAKRIVSELSKKPGNNYADNDIDTITNVFVNKDGRNMQYDAMPIFNVDNSTESEFDLASPEKLRYVEIIVCNDGGNKYNEKYAVHENNPDHDCGANCSCILHTFEIQGKHVREVDKSNNYGQNKIRHGNQFGGLGELSSPSAAIDTSDDSDVETSSDSDMDIDSDELDDKKNFKGGDKNRKKRTKEEDDKADKIDGDLSIDEDGIMLSHGAIDTEDLIAMQSRLFGLDTPARYESGHDNISLTEEIEQAMNDIDSKKQMFNSEEHKIMNMSSDKNKFKKAKVNVKYR